MRMSIKQTALIFFVVLVAGLTAVGFAAERDDLGYYSLVDEQGNTITMAGRELDPGDHYISADNRLFEVVDTEGDTVNVRYLETVQLPDITEELLSAQVGRTEDAQGVVGIYHTHNAESYVPSSGTDSKDDGEGDILVVGRTLADAMEELGLTVHWSSTSHLPHDGQAYNRSRRTAMDLLQKDADTLLDVHRDATPPEVYDTEIEGESAIKVRLVVGRQNQNHEANLEYAKRIKAIGDNIFPGIIEGIFDAQGNYNQDLGPKTILLEFGAHTNSLEQAEQTAQFFAKVLPAAAGLTTSTQDSAEEQIGSGASRSLIWMIVIVAVVAVVFLLISQGKIRSPLAFFRREAGIADPNDEEQDDR